MREELVLELQLMCTDEVGFPLHAVALNGMTKSPGKRAIFDLTFDQIVLRAFLHGFGGQGLVVQARQHDHRHVWGRRVGPTNRIEAMPIRQAHVQQDDVHSTFRKVNLGLSEAQEVRQFEAARLLLAEHLAEQTDISRIILDQKNLERLSFHERASRGNLTTDSQKPSMLFTTLRNPSRSTGLAV